MRRVKVRDESWPHPKIRGIGNLDTVEPRTLKGSREDDLLPMNTRSGYGDFPNADVCMVPNRDALSR